MKFNGKAKRLRQLTRLGEDLYRASRFLERAGTTSVHAFNRVLHSTQHPEAQKSIFKTRKALSLEVDRLVKEINAALNLEKNEYDNIQKSYEEDEAYYKKEVAAARAVQEEKSPCRKRKQLTNVDTVHT